MPKKLIKPDPGNTNIKPEDDTKNIDPYHPDLPVSSDGVVKDSDGNVDRQQLDPENASALEHVEAALESLHTRTRDRLARERSKVLIRSKNENSFTDGV